MIFYAFLMSNEEVLKYVAYAIRTVRKQKKISQMELCLRANMSQGFLTNIETGKKEPSTMTLIRIAEALEVSPRDFFPETDTNSSFDVKSEIKNEITELLARL